MNTFVTSDTHFSHPNILIHCARRPWVKDNPSYDPNKPRHFRNNNPLIADHNDVISHDEALIDNWNRVVGKQDRVFLLGDFAYKNHSKIIQRLNGKKTLVTGNHDKMNQISQDMFDSDEPDTRIVDQMVAKWVKAWEKSGEASANTFIADAVRDAWRTFSEFRDMGCIDDMPDAALKHFTAVHEMGCRKLLGIGQMKKNKSGFEAEAKQDVTLCHYPMMSWASSCHGSWLLHGHCHGRMPDWDNKLMIDVGVDIWGYTPVPIEAIIRKMAMKKDSQQDPDASVPDASFSRDPEQRVARTRKKNLKILREVGIDVRLDADLGDDKD